MICICSTKESALARVLGYSECGDGYRHITCRTEVPHAPAHVHWLSLACVQSDGVNSAQNSAGLDTTSDDGSEGSSGDSTGSQGSEGAAEDSGARLLICLTRATRMMIVI